MTEDDRPAFVAGLTMLAEAFNEPMSAGRLEAYWYAVEDLPLATVTTAMRQVLRDASGFFPKPGQLREHAGEREPDAGLIEALLVTHLRKPGVLPSLPADPFLATVCRHLGGMRQVVEMPSGVRIAHIAKVLPGVVAAARDRGWALPGPTADLPAIAYRPVDAPQLPEPESHDPRDRNVPVVLADYVRRVTRGV